MKYSGTFSTLVLGASFPAASAFPSKGCRRTARRNNQHQHQPLFMSTYSEDELSLLPKEEKIDTTYFPSQYGKKRSEAIPFLNCPPTLKNSELAGNIGFDPLGLAKNKEQLWEYREAEVKHARLAMLAAIGWPVSELLDRDIADFFAAPSMLDSGDRAPTVLNGGLENINPRFWGFCLGLSAAVDMYGVAKARRGDPEYFPGNLGFDPLNFFTDDKQVQERLKLAEIKHGRVAMVGVSGYVLEEYITKMAVIDDTPMLFQPFTETVEEAVIGAVQVEEALESAVIGNIMM